ncbi:hypothetical protein [Streptomyces sp. NPDC003247]|uniref:hypothetical protein n=1 Tax=Streptomyces sp. NPDC003247 TaxID=3364677 RepID=UPI0036930938
MTTIPGIRPGGPDWGAPERRFRSEQTALREQFAPQRVPLLARSYATDVLLPIVQDMRASGAGGLLSVVAEAGSGKTVLLGHLFQLLCDSDGRSDSRSDGNDHAGEGPGSALGPPPAPAVLVRCDQVVLPDASPAPPAPRPGEPLPAVSPTALLDHAFGAAAGSGLLTAAVQQYAGERPVLLLDTLDLLLSPRWSKPLGSYLSELVDIGITVVLTCRPRDYEDHASGLIPAVQGNGRMAVLKDVPALDEDEIVDFTRQFLTDRGIPPAVGEEEFGGRLVALSAGGAHVRLRRLLSSPLLLAMVCEVFGETGGHVPQDLTTSGLYARYWEEKVSRTRLTGSADASDQRIEDKETLCRRMAAFLWHASRTRSRFHDRVPAARLTGSATGTGSAAGTGAGRIRAALRELCDDGFLNTVERGQVVEFRHQTLAEYAVAQWLVELDDERSDFYDELRERPSERGFALPVLRHLVGMEDTLHQLDDVFPLLPLGDFGVFRNTAFAVANCGNDTYVTALAAEATRRIDQRLRSLWEALETVAGRGLAAARAAALRGLRELPYAQVAEAGGLYGLLAVRRGEGGEAVDLADGVRAVHGRRADWPPLGTTVARQPDQVLQLMLDPALAVGAPVSTGTVRAVEEDFAQAGRATREAFVRLLLAPGTPPGHTAAFLRFLWTLPAEVHVPRAAGAEFVTGAMLGTGRAPEAVLDALITDLDGCPDSRLAQHAAVRLVADRPALRDRLWPHLGPTAGSAEVRLRAANVVGDLCADPAVASDTFARLVAMDVGPRTDVGTGTAGPTGAEGAPGDDGDGAAVLYGIGQRVLPSLASPDERAELGRWLARLAPPTRRRGREPERRRGDSPDRDTLRDLPLDRLVEVAADTAHDVTARQAAGSLRAASQQGTLLTAGQWRTLLASRWSGTRRSAVTLLDALLRAQDPAAGLVAPALLTCGGADATPGERQTLYTALDSWLRGYPEGARPHLGTLREVLRGAAESGDCAGEPAKAWVALTRTCFESALKLPEERRAAEARAAFGVYGAAAAAGALPTRGPAAALGVKLLVRAVNHGVVTPEELARLARSWRCGGQCTAVGALVQTAGGGAWSPLLHALLDDGVLCRDAVAALVRLRETD